MTRKSKRQLKTSLATAKRRRERQANNRRAAWNRVGLRFGLSKEEVDHAKSADLNPYTVLRGNGLTAASVRNYIRRGHFEPDREFGWGDLAIATEIARFQQLDSEGGHSTSADFDDWF